MKYVWIYLVLFGVNILTAWGVGMWIPDYRAYLVNEDSLVEHLSAFLFLSTFFLSFLFVIKSKKNRKSLIIVSAVGLLGFLDEISFGERLFMLNMPIIGGKKIDAVHDLFELGYKGIKILTHSHAIFVYLLILIGGGAIMAVTRVALKYRYKLIAIISNGYYKQTYILALFFASLVFAALIIDLGIIHNNALFTLEELLEMNAAMALLFSCLSLCYQNKTGAALFKRQSFGKRKVSIKDSVRL